VSIGILGNKIGMTQIFDTDGLAIPVSVIRVGPCLVTQIKTKEKEGYEAIQIGYSQVNPKKLSKAELGHLSKSALPTFGKLKEYRVNSTTEYTVGQLVTVSQFEVGQFVNVQGQSIGKGFTGNQKRHNFARGPMAHGSKNHRAPGSIGAGTTPGRVFPGKKMAGQHGAKTTTTAKLKVLGIDTKRNLMIVKGCVPGKPGNDLSIIPAN